MEYLKLKDVADIYLGLTHTPKYVSITDLFHFPINILYSFSITISPVAPSIVIIEQAISLFTK